MNFWNKIFGNADLDNKLVQAIERRSLDEVRALLVAGARANAQVKRSDRGAHVNPAIHLALASEYAGESEEEVCLKIIDSLLAHGADIEAQGTLQCSSKKEPFTPLMIAVQQDRAKTVEFLIERGANTSVHTLDGRTVFQVCRDTTNTHYDERHWSIQRTLTEHTEDGKAWAKSPEGQRWLRDRVKDPKAPLGVSPRGAWSELQGAMALSSTKQNEIIRWVELGGNVNWTCSAGMTLLHYAVMKDNEEMVRFLLDHGANVNALAQYNMTPLLQACKSASNSKSVIMILLDYGADPNAQSESGYTALQFIRQSYLQEEEIEEIVELFLSLGVATTPGKDLICNECGAPDTTEMGKRGVEFTFNGAFVTFACVNCGAQGRVELRSIGQGKGIQALCTCGAVAHIPASIWCKTCGQGLSTGWQALVH